MKQNLLKWWIFRHYRPKLSGIFYCAIEQGAFTVNMLLARNIVCISGNLRGDFSDVMMDFHVSFLQKPFIKLLL